MTRYLLWAGVVLAEVAVHAAVHPGWGEAARYGLAVTLVVLVGSRSAGTAFVAALAMMSVAGPGYVLLLWAGWQAGRSIVSRVEVVAVVGAVTGAVAGQLVIRAGQPQSIPSLIFTLLVFVVLPVLVGRSMAQHQRLLEASAENNRRLRQGREILAEQERLRERLRIARDMHDSLGHRLSLVSVQAAALEVAGLPPEQRAAVEQLAGSARSAMDELYELIGALRTDGVPPPSPSRGVSAIPSLVARARAAGLVVELRQRGRARPVTAGCEESAYRVVEEGLTNAAKHAPGQPVSVEVAWEPDALLVTVANPSPPGGPGRATAGHGLLGLGERVVLAEGFLDHRLHDGQFRLVAMLPVAEQPADAEPRAGRGRLVAVGVAAAVIMFGLLQVGMVTGVSA
ncbi:signal transduction histidine kinase [Allocatelliglobosispora scoriae]|uniref:histidine kinase n=1 Tax=Allocatelliglobosispora scoriae TaxID=643052 RepID=A0A841C2V9_9ACTN|nr:histidine kinase [Allocatelliglobosispora scoriae]MBB5874245.1 signal transduction histidine kinase [Allocatelliglobosispora scoriae]